MNNTNKNNNKAVNKCLVSKMKPLGSIWLR